MTCDIKIDFENSNMILYVHYFHPFIPPYSSSKCTPNHSNHCDLIFYYYYHFIAIYVHIYTKCFHLTFAIYVSRADHLVLDDVSRGPSLEKSGSHTQQQRITYTTSSLGGAL